MMNVKPGSCKGCPLYSLGQGFALFDGKGTSEVLVVAEALGEDEAIAGKPLVGKAGQTWDRMVSRTVDPVLGRLTRDTFRHANVISCRPPDNFLVGAPYEHEAIRHCDRHVGSVIDGFKPKAILTLGNVPLRKFTGNWGIEQLRGYVFETPWGPVIPTYHPSYIQRGKWNLARVVQMDICRALEVAREGSKIYHRDKEYILNPSYQEATAFLAGWVNAGRPQLAFDIETPMADEAAENEDMVFEDDASYTILMISLAYEPYKAISIPWIEPFITLVKAALKEAPQTLVWNAKFDVPRLIANGVDFGGEIIDSMIAWHWLEPALPMGLKYVATFYCPDMAAWKLEMHKNFQWYNAADSDVLLRVHKAVQAKLEAQSRWTVFHRHFVEFGKLLNSMTVRGVQVDQERRKAAREHFGARFEDVVGRADALAPITIKSVHPKRGYAKTPKDTTDMVQIFVELTEKEELKLQKDRDREREKLRKLREKAERRIAREAQKRDRVAAKEKRDRERAAARAAKQARREPEA